MPSFRKNTLEPLLCTELLSHHGEFNNLFTRWLLLAILFHALEPPLSRSRRRRRRGTAGL